LQKSQKLFRAKDTSPILSIVSLDEIETLDEIHAGLDQAVLDAYGWPHNLNDEQILERLLKLNLERFKNNESQ